MDRSRLHSANGSTAVMLRRNKHPIPSLWVAAFPWPDARAGGHPCPTLAPQPPAQQRPASMTPWPCSAHYVGHDFNSNYLPTLFVTGRTCLRYTSAFGIGLSRIPAGLRQATAGPRP